MDTIKVKQRLYHWKHSYLTSQNIVMVVALLVSAGWAWGSVAMMQRNYTLQHNIDNQLRQAELLELEVATMQYEQSYFNSPEYKDLAARQRLGLVSPGEKVLMLPPNSEAAKQVDKPDVQPVQGVKRSNFEQWLDFLLGNNAVSTKDLQ